MQQWDQCYAVGNYLELINEIKRVIDAKAKDDQRQGL